LKRNKQIEFDITIKRITTISIFVGVVFCLLCVLANKNRTESQARAGIRHLLISEVYYDTNSGSSAEEWIEIYNPTRDKIDLSNYKIGDEETNGGGEGMYRFPDGAKIKANEKIVIAAKASAFRSLYKKLPDYEFIKTEECVLSMRREKDWAAGIINLANSGDEVLLLDKEDNPVDVVVYENGQFLNIVPHQGVEISHSLERACRVMDTDNCENDFFDQANPNPGIGLRSTRSGNLRTGER